MFNVGNENCFSLSFSDTVDIDIKLIIYNNVSVNFKCYHPPGNPRVNLQDLANPSHLGKFFLSNAQPSDFLGNHYFNKFYTFPPVSISQSLE